MGAYIFATIIWAAFGAGAYWNEHYLIAVFFAAAASHSLTAATLSSRMDNIDAIIEKRVERIWDAIAELKNR